MISSYKELLVWQMSIDLCTSVYQCTESFPKEEIFGLVSQIRRCSVSVPSNIAEGFMRKSNPEFKHFLRIAYASGAELETQLLIANKIGYLKKIQYESLTQRLDGIMRMLNKLIAKIEPTKQKG